MKNGGKVLLLTLVHPVYLPPVSTLAAVLRDAGYQPHILTFQTAKNTQATAAHGIVLETVGQHDGLPLRARVAARKRFTARAGELSSDAHAGIIAFCAFSFLSALKVKGTSPVIYHALEMADFKWSYIRRSPLSMVNNYFALARAHRADLLCTPSPQRSAWMAGRCDLNKMPVTVLNTTYEVTNAVSTDRTEVFARLLPDAGNKTVLLYMGSVNSTVCILELVAAFRQLNRQDCLLVIAGMKATDYCRQVGTAAQGDANIRFFNFVAGEEKAALQQCAHIGICLSREAEDDLESKMTAPNKVGEYLAAGLYVLASNTDYMKPIAAAGVASLAGNLQPDTIARAISEAIEISSNQVTVERIKQFVTSYYNMQVQARPILDMLS